MKIGTWTYVDRKSDMNVISHKWTFRVKSLKADFSNTIQKERCITRGDLQESYKDYNPHKIYTTVARQGSIRVCMAFEVGNSHIIEGGYVANTYLYGDLDVPIYMYPPTNLTGIQTHPWKVFWIEKSNYGARQAGMIWGTFLIKHFTNWGFISS